MLVLWCNIRWQWMSYFTIKERLHNFCWTVAELSTSGNWTTAAHWTSLSVQYCHVPLALKTLSLGSLSESERNRIAKNKQVSPLSMNVLLTVTRGENSLKVPMKSESMFKCLITYSLLYVQPFANFGPYIDKEVILQFVNSWKPKTEMVDDSSCTRGAYKFCLQ